METAARVTSTLKMELQPPDWRITRSPESLLAPSTFRFTVMEEERESEAAGGTDNWNPSPLKVPIYNLIS
ncbi:hypothetical protein KRR40_35280 [Niabella defluvii]|nr:hypothetical protein KRR40_35280 [Niabella sp. I65]